MFGFGMPAKTKAHEYGRSPRKEKEKEGPGSRAERVVIGVLVTIVLGLIGVLVWAVAAGKFASAAGVSSPVQSAPPVVVPVPVPVPGPPASDDESEAPSVMQEGTDVPLLVGLGVVVLLVLYLIWVIYYISVLRPGRAERFLKLATKELPSGFLRGAADDEEIIDVIKRTILPRYVVMRRGKAGKLMNKFKKELTDDAWTRGAKEVERLLPRTVPERLMRYVAGATGRSTPRVAGEDGLDGGSEK